MKRIILLICLIILYCIVIIQKSKGVFAEKINLNLDDNEIGVVFFKYKEEEFLLFKQNDINHLFLIDGQNKINITGALNIFGINRIDNLIYYTNNSLKINSKKEYSVDDNIDLGNIKFNRNNNIIKINLYNYNLCIYSAGSNYDISDCTYIYFRDIDDKLKISDKNKVVFYEENISEEFQEKLYIKWIDSYSLSDNVYTVLKVKIDNYNIINIPIQ